MKVDANPLEGKKVIFVPNPDDPVNADGVRGHLEVVGDVSYTPGTYEKWVKPAIDKVLALLAMILLSPLYLFLHLSVYVHDPGPTIFKQKRIGRNKKYISISKYRTMRMNAPYEVPTHMMEDPDQYTTAHGKFLRRYSLDELPQFWEIFVGKMSIVGPRPALWNQDYLVAERDKYGANNVRPGLTGWAQINGRDTLSIEEKAKLDGDYVKNLSFAFDCRCFFGTFFKVLRAEGVVDNRVETEIPQL